MTRALASGLLLIAAVAGGVRAARQTPPLVVDASPALATVAARVHAMAPAAIDAALGAAGLERPGHVHITLLDEDHPAARQTPLWVVGSASGADRIVIYPQRVGNYPYDSLESVVLHEIAHLALFARAGGQPLPRWFHEGVAVAVESGWGLGGEMRLLVAAAHEPAIAEVSALFASEAQPSTTTAYLLSTALVADIRRRHGGAVPGEIAARVAAGDAFDAAFVAVTGETPDQAAATAWRVYRGVSWIPVVTSASGVWGAILLLATLAFVARRRRRLQRRRAWEIEERAQAADTTGDPPAPLPGE